MREKKEMKQKRWEKKKLILLIQPGQNNSAQPGEVDTMR